MSEVKISNSVSWAQLWAVVCGVITAIFGIMLFALDSHASHPHAGAVTHEEQRQLEKRLDTHFELIQRQLDEIKVEIRRK